MAKSDTGFGHGMIGVQAAPDASVEEVTGRGEIVARKHQGQALGGD